MYTDSTYISTYLREQFEALEDELGIPIRVLSGQGRSHPDAPEWQAAHFGDLGPTEGGITVWSWGLLSPGDFVTAGTLSGEVFTDGEPRISGLYDSYVLLNPEDSAYEVMPYTVDSYHFVEVGSGAVAYGLSFDTVLSNWRDELNFDEFFGNPIRLAADPNFAESFDELRAARSQEAFVRLATQGQERLLNRVRQSLSDREQEHSTASRKLACSREQMTQLQHELDAILGSNELSADELRSRWESLSQHRYAERAYVIGDKLVVETPFLRIEDPRTGEDAPLGRMQFTFAPARQEVTWRNLDLPRHNRAHPHCQQGSHPCLGTAQETMAEYLARHEYVAVLDLSIQAATSFNPRDDYGRYAGYWLDSEEARAEREGTADPEEQAVLTDEARLLAVVPEPAA